MTVSLAEDNLVLIITADHQVNYCIKGERWPGIRFESFEAAWKHVGWYARSNKALTKYFEFFK